MKKCDKKSFHEGASVLLSLTNLYSNNGGVARHKEGADGDQGSDRRPARLRGQDGQTEEGELR